ncbi:hypothetical protein [Clostridium thermobutyricum]|uniref:hypothetical protein n=1 Tax=Clostridium thermobutyricum TaxID=29372 RepID=UPI0018A978D3|nr:hypothetical protein [Clostridium thermobutyricum]
MSKKIKFLIGIGVVCVAIIGGSIYLFSKNSSNGNNAMENKLDNTKAIEQVKTNKTNKSNDVNKHKEVDTKANTNNNKSTDKSVDSQNNIKNAPTPPPSITNMQGNNVAENCYYATFGNNPKFPKILQNDNNNFLELVSVYAATWIQQMKKDALAAQQGKFSKSEYISNITLTQQMFENLQNGLNKFSSQVNDPSVSTNANKLNNLVSNVISEVTAEANQYQTSSVGTPMFTVLPFGSNFNNNIQLFNSFADALGSKNNSVKQEWVNFAIKQLQ